MASSSISKKGWVKLVNANSIYLAGFTERDANIPNISGYDKYLLCLGPYVDESVGDFKGYKTSVIIPRLYDIFWFNVLPSRSGSSYAEGKVVLYSEALHFYEFSVHGSISGITYELYGYKE